MNEQALTELESRIADLEERVTALEGEPSSSEIEHPSLDQYDSMVLEKLDPGQTVGIQQFNSMYRQSGVLNPGKIKQRLRRLTSLDLFEEADGRQRWRFIGEAE